MLRVPTKCSTTSLVSIIFTRSIRSKSSANSSKHAKAVSSKFSQPPQQQQTTIKYVKYPYFVARTQMKELPVYIDIKNGETRVLTEISRIEGDSEALCNDIQKELFYWSREKNLIRVNHTNNHIIIKGRYGLMVKKWLAKKGF